MPDALGGFGGRSPSRLQRERGGVEVEEEEGRESKEWRDGGGREEGWMEDSE
jgi:hypothetical protein